MPQNATELTTLASSLDNYTLYHHKIEGKDYFSLRSSINAGTLFTFKRLSQISINDVVFETAEELINSFNANFNTDEYVPENILNKQNNLNTDDTGGKFPNVTAVNAGLALKVDKVTGESLVSDTEIAKLVNLDNTKDIDKPVSTPQENRMQEVVGAQITNSTALTNPNIAIVPTGNVHILGVGPGTYSFWGNQTVPANNIATLRRVGGVFSMSLTPLDLSTKLNVSDLSNNLNSTSTVLGLNLAGAKLLNDKDLTNVKGILGKNLYNKTKNTLNFYLNSANGALVANSDYQTSDFISINPSTLYQVTFVTFVCYYSASYNFISGTSVNETTSFTTPANAAFVRFSTFNSYMTSGQQLEAGSVKTVYEDYAVKVPVINVLGLSAEIISQGYVKPIVGKNLYNKLNNTLGYYLNAANGALVVNASYATSEFIPIVASTLYQVTWSTFICYYNSSKVFISGTAVNGTTSFTTPANAAFVRFSADNVFMNGSTQLEVGAVKTNYEEYMTIFESKYIKTFQSIITKTVKRNGTVGVDCDYTGRRGIQDAIDSVTDATIDKQYIIKASGVFEATETGHFDSVVKSFILLKPYVHLIGTNKDDCVISGYLANNLGTGFLYSNHQTVYHNVANSRIENVTITGENLRYPIHIDGGRLGMKDVVQTLKNVKIWHKGNTGDAAVQWGSYTPLGLGTSDGQIITLEDCELKGKVYAGYMHNNESFTNPSIVKHIRTKFITTSGPIVLVLQSMGSGVRDKYILENCTVDNGVIQYYNSPWVPVQLANQRADHAEIELVMNNAPKAFDNSLMSGKGLIIKSKTTGSTSTVFFDQNATAFNLIIGNSLETNEVTNRYGYQQKYGYQFKIGGQGLSGFAIGLLDIQQYTVGINQNQYIGALGKRLGDCSVTNKTLTVIINGTSYNVVFNKNYNGTASTVAPNYSNTQIIAEINAVIGAVADVDEYVVGKDYYPQFDGILNMVNGDVTEVLAGMGVVFTGIKGFRKALNSDNKIDGICIDDGRVGDECRIITKGEIYASITNQRFDICEVSSATRLIGTQLGISTTVAGKFDVVATPKLLFTKSTNILGF